MMYLLNILKDAVLELFVNRWIIRVIKLEIVRKNFRSILDVNTPIDVVQGLFEKLEILRTHKNLTACVKSILSNNQVNTLYCM